MTRSENGPGKRQQQEGGGMLPVRLNALHLMNRRKLCHCVRFAMLGYVGPRR